MSVQIPTPELFIKIWSLFLYRRSLEHNHVISSCKECDLFPQVSILQLHHEHLQEEIGGSPGMGCLSSGH